MRLATLAITFTVLLAGSAHAGGNPDDNEPMGVMTREPLQEAQPIRAPIPDQYQIQREAEAEVRKGWVEMNLSAPQDNDAVNAESVKPVIIARAEPGPLHASKCVWPFSLADDCDATMFSDHDPSPVGFTTVYGTKTVEIEKTDRFSKNFGKGLRGFFRAKHTAHKLAKKGYEVRFGYKHGWRVKAKKTYTEEIQVPTMTRVRNDRSGASNGGVHSGDTGRERDEHGPEMND